LLQVFNMDNYPTTIQQYPTSCLELLYYIMKLNLLSCDAQRPDRRAIAQCIAAVSFNTDVSLSNELTDILLEGDPVDIQVEDKNSGSALRALRKLSIDYEIIE
jgi:hypothetical protein